MNAYTRDCALAQAGGARDTRLGAVPNYAFNLMQDPSVEIPVDTTGVSTSGDWLTNVQRIATAALGWDSSRKLNEINLERARQGLPPLDPAQYSGVGVNVGLTPQTQQLVIWGVVALVAVLFLMRKKS